jgi:protein-L-isoaspartate(D-aspartate) O-methyltransferase
MSLFGRVAGRDPDDLVRAAERIGVRDERVLDALRAVRREDYVPPGHERAAYSDRPIPIPHGQTTSQPSLIAAMVEALELEGGDKVLEVGTGYGFQTALLAELADEVWSIERYGELAETAAAHLDAAGVTNAHVVVGDGNEGIPEEAPFDAIILSAAAPSVPGPLADQLAEGGRLVVPVGAGGSEDVVVYRRRGDQLERVRSLTRARFVPLRRGAVPSDD